jgi:hypothetical protein
MYQHIVLSHATPQRTHAPHVRQTTHVPQATRCLTHIQRFTAHSGVMSRAPQRQRQCKSHSAAAAAPRVVGEKACCCASAPERSPSGSSQHTSAYVSMRTHTHIYIYIYIYIYTHTHSGSHLLLRSGWREGGGRREGVLFRRRDRRDGHLSRARIRGVPHRQGLLGMGTHI